MREVYTPLRLHTCVYQGVRNVIFSENLVYVLNGWSLGYVSNSNSKILESQRDLDFWDNFQNLLYGCSYGRSLSLLHIFQMKKFSISSRSKFVAAEMNVNTIHLKRCLWVNKSLKYQVSSRFEEIAAFGAI